MNKKLKLCGYVRISVDLFEDRDNTSIENQKAIIREFVKTNFPDATLDIYEDRDRSGYTFEQREGYQEMRRKMMSGCYDALILKDFSRFSRRNSKGLCELEDLKDAGMRIISIGDSIDFPKDDDWLKIQFQFLINEMPVTDTSKKIKAVIDRRQKDGKWICNVPYGYEMIDYKAMSFKVNESCALIVKKIFELYCSGWGYKKIAEYLTEHNLPTPSMIKKEHYEQNGNESKAKSNSVWNTASVRTILNNDFYIGILRQRKYTRTKINGKDVKLNDNDNIVFENHHEAIIDEKTFRRAQDLMSKRTKDNYRGVGKYSTKYTGVLVCGDCGSPMFSRSRPDMLPSYICGNYHKHGTKACSSHHTRFDFMDSLLRNYLVSVRGLVESQTKLISDLLDNGQNETPRDRKSTIDKLNEKIAESQEELKATKRQRIRDCIRNPDNEDIINETYDELEDELCRKIDSFRSQIDMCEDADDKANKLNKTSKNVVALFDELIEKEELSELDIKNLVNKIFVFENHIVIELEADVQTILTNRYSVDAKGLKVEQLADEFFKDEIIHKAVHQKPKKFEVNIKSKETLCNNVVSDEQLNTDNVIKEGDPLEIFTDAEGEVIFKKYSPIGELSNFANQYAEVLHKNGGLPIAIMDNDHVIAASGISKREILERRVTKSLEELMENRAIHIASDTVPSMSAIEGFSRKANVVYPIMYGGDVSGAVALIEDEDHTLPTETDIKLVQVAAAFLGKQME